MIKDLSTFKVHRLRSEWYGGIKSKNQFKFAIEVDGISSLLVFQDSETRNWFLAMLRARSPVKYYPWDKINKSWEPTDVFKDAEIGSIIEIDGKKFKVQKGGCMGCHFDSPKCCPGERGCLSQFRKDKKNVQFRIVK